ncbi:Nucleoside-diphosphate-sugar epimerase [Sphingomonas gellani]|uniref:Nucleoside-diphosphate-sugar epimerase n=1 Tax=Sphingomonas gellani TaxID=1166340 RepID=A0A1H8FMN6_9SPHN|nr:NAD(P)H-binding protein [Sphingomonas gellani]SEN32348.1 Nucleoside-diphosphate-sugar epimerase [Sphingomonas gellani]
MILALTGATGFVGRHTLDRALAAGHSVRALTRRAQPARDDVIWVEGALDDAAALDQLVIGVDAVVHIAGVVSAPDRAGFATGNIDGTRMVVAAAERAGVPRLVHVSSLAAREPGLSLYGWSKREAEAVVESSRLHWTIVRPSGVYGPGDTEMVDMFRLARFGVALTPPAGRVSLIAVEDLAALLVILAENGPANALYEVDDGMLLSHAALGRAIGRAVGRHHLIPIALPAAALRLGARIDRRLRGAHAKLTPDRVGYLLHPDWTADPARRPPATLWAPATPSDIGLAATARWYRDRGLL